MATHFHTGFPCSICGFPLEGEAKEAFMQNTYQPPFHILPLKPFTTTKTTKPKTVKSYLKAAIMLANTPIINLKGIEKLNEDEQRILSTLSVVLQNELGENDELLEKFKLRYQ